ncbi:fumarylacetoacetate hydrolase [Paracidovorax avenae]|uniref:2-keto-4-pentenoate hydratase n=1 Tax=Paracidovorax avenae TaxID=80867 RepID=UPI000D152991|nr:fumarylacetoacetate hydrolase [Paracidovorax avenae]AVS84755.1 fumarylacetoacetate hydrolase [Paracidovorax avenae]AVS88175.1 fumarylacetoacetate hydrolase [Paracidovorax avenae]
MALQQTLIAALAAVACVTGTRAACLDDAQVADLAAHYMARTPAANPPPMDAADAACTRARFNALLEQRMGKPVGYKAGLTNPAVQQRFRTDQPVWGRLYPGMVLPSGSTVDAAFGARPLYEADMLVRVKSAAINHARTPLEVLDAIDQVIPFIELPDLLVQVPPQLDGAGVAAINVGARLGVAGAPIAVPALRAERYALLDALATMTVTLTDGTGARLGGGRGSDILGHPLQAVVWLAGALQKEDAALQPGDIVSLGSFSALLSPRPGLAVTATFAGLPGAAPVEVRFK